MNHLRTLLASTRRVFPDWTNQSPLIWLDLCLEIVSFCSGSGIFSFKFVPRWLSYISEISVMAMVFEVWGSLRARLLIGTSSIAFLSPFTTPKFSPFPSLHERLVQIPNRFVCDWAGAYGVGPLGLRMGWRGEERLTHLWWTDNPGVQSTEVIEVLLVLIYLLPS